MFHFFIMLQWLLLFHYPLQLNLRLTLASHLQQQRHQMIDRLDIGLRLCCACICAYVWWENSHRICITFYDEVPHSFYDDWFYPTVNWFSQITVNASLIGCNLWCLCLYFCSLCECVDQQSNIVWCLLVLWWMGMMNKYEYELAWQRWWYSYRLPTYPEKSSSLWH